MSKTMSRIFNSKRIEENNKGKKSIWKNSMISFEIIKTNNFNSKSNANFISEGGYLFKKIDDYIKKTYLTNTKF